MTVTTKARVETLFVSGMESECDPQLPELVRQANPELFKLFYNGDQALLRKLFTAEWPMEIGFFSRANMTIATQDKRPVGLLNCFAGKKMGVIYQTHIQLVPSVLEADATNHLVSGLIAMGWLFPFVPSDALYVFTLVVSKKVRQTGIGAKLMAIAEEKAKADGMKSIHLDTATNSRAAKFYKNLGYHAVVETRLCQLREGETVPSHQRMVKSFT